MTYLPVQWKPPAKEYFHVSEAEATAIWTACLKPQYRLFTKVLWFTGLRINETLAIQYKNVMNGPDGYCLVVTRLKKGEHTHPERLPVSAELGQALKDFSIASKLQATDKLFPGHENRIDHKKVYLKAVTFRKAGTRPDARRRHPPGLVHS
jgi:integrase